MPILDGNNIVHLLHCAEKAIAVPIPLYSSTVASKALKTDQHSRNEKLSSQLPELYVLSYLKTLVSSCIEAQAPVLLVCKRK